MSETNERSVASTGSVAGGVIEHARKCVDFWRSMMSGADRIGMEAPSLAIGGVVDLVDGLLAETARIRLTDAEREAVDVSIRDAEQEYELFECGEGIARAATLRGILERLG